MAVGIQVDKEWRIKKLRSEKASKTAFAFKVKRDKGGDGRSSKSIRQLPSKEMMIKITGSATTAKGIKNTIDYISHEGELSLYDEHGEEYFGERVVSELKNSMVDSGDVAPSVSADQDATLLKKQTHNFVYSPPPSEKVSRQELLDTVRETMCEKYPNHAFVMAYHDNTEKPHVHVVFKISDKDGRRTHIKKADIRQLRTGMSIKLQGLGYNVKATHKRDLGLKNDLAKEPENTRNKYEVLKFGTTYYQFDPKNKRSSFITYKTLSGNKEVTVWGKNLPEEIEREQVQVGHIITLKKEGATTVKVPFYDDKGEVLGHREVKRNDWKIENTSVEGLDRTLDKAVSKKKVIDLDTPERRVKHLSKKLDFARFKEKMEKIKLGIKVKW